MAGVRDSTLIDVDLEAFGDAFAKRSIQVRHGLSDHPLFTLEAIAELADRLPPDAVRRQSGQLPFVYTDGYVDVGSGPPSQTILDIERNGVRVMLRDIHQDAAYAEVIHDCLDQVQTALGGREGGMVHRAGYLFISAPAARTPMHFDVEHSFLLQVRGTKHVHVAAFADRPEMLTRERERYLDGRQSDFESMQSAAETFRLESGLGVYLPSYVPHWVETETGVSISFSIPWFTAFCRRAESVYRINSLMRRIRLSPRPMGVSQPVDDLKVRAHHAWLRRAAIRQWLTSRADSTTPR